MEIATTMVKFLCPLEVMEKRTSKAQLFIVGDKDKPEKVWVPLGKLEIRRCIEAPEFNEVVMPKWLFMKTILPFYTDTKEYVVKLEVNDVFHLISDSK